MTILCVWQECSRNVLWIVFSCTPFPRPLVRASSNNSSTIEFGARGGEALPLVPSPLLVAARWDRGEVTLGRLTAIPLRRVTLQGWEFFPLFLPAPSFTSITSSQNKRQPRKKISFFFFFYVEEIFIDTFSPPCAWGRGHRAAAEGSAGFLPAKTSTTFSIVDQLRAIVSPGVAFTLLQIHSPRRGFELATRCLSVWDLNKRSWLPHWYIVPK